MSVHPIAIFADQITPGMRISKIHKAYGEQDGPSPVVSVTQVRTFEANENFLAAFSGTTTRSTPQVNVVILGTHDDGTPFDYFCGAQMAWHCHTAPLEVEL